jgi:hypothetical protein
MSAKTQIEFLAKLQILSCPKPKNIAYRNEIQKVYNLYQAVYFDCLYDLKSRELLENSKMDSDKLLHLEIKHAIYEVVLQKIDCRLNELQISSNPSLLPSGWYVQFGSNYSKH